MTVPLAGGSLPASGLVVKNTKISGGQTAAQLWQGGIKTANGTKTGSGVAVKTTGGPGRVDVALGVKAGDFTKVAVKRGAGWPLGRVHAHPETRAARHDDAAAGDDLHPAGHDTTPTFTSPTTTTPPVTHTTPPQTTTTPAGHAHHPAADAHDDADLHRQLGARTRRAAGV